MDKIIKKKLYTKIQNTNLMPNIKGIKKWGVYLKTVHRNIELNKYRIFE